MLTGRSERSFHQCPVLANSIASQLVKNGSHRTGIASLPGWSTRSCPTYGRSQHLRVTVSLNPLGGGACCCPQTPEARKVSGIRLHLPGVLTPRRVGPQISVLRLPQFLHAPTQNSKDLEKSTNSCDPYARKVIGGPKELLSHIPAVCPL